MSKQKKTEKFIEKAIELAIENFWRNGLTKFSVQFAIAVWKIFTVKNSKEKQELVSDKQILETKNKIIENVLAELEKKYAKKTVNKLHIENCIDKTISTLSDIQKEPTSENFKMYLSQKFKVERFPILEEKQKSLCSTWLTSQNNIEKVQKRTNIPSISNYEVLYKIGTGASSNVYLAKDKSNNQYRALKIGILENKLLFQREVEMLKLTDSSKIVKYYQSGTCTSEGNIYYWIALEYISSYTLRDLIEEKNLTLETILNIIEQILEALASMHKQKLLHRDLKPENIMIDLNDFQIKFTDLGLVKATDHDKSLALTQTGDIKGTPLYMSPERTLDKETTTASDIWSVGIIIYELLKKKPPFYGKTVFALALSIHNSEPDYDQLQPEFKKLLQSFLNKDPLKRIQNGVEAHSLFMKEINPVRKKIIWNKILNEKLLSNFFEKYDTKPTNIVDAFQTFSNISIAILPKETITDFLSNTFDFHTSKKRLHEKIWTYKNKFSTSIDSITGLEIISIGNTISNCEKEIIDLSKNFKNYIGKLHAFPATETNIKPEKLVSIEPLSKKIDNIKFSTQVEDQDNKKGINEPKIEVCMPGFTFFQKNTYSCGGQTHTVKEYCHSKTGMMFVLIPSGRFHMGCDEGYYNEKPAHTKNVNSFLIAKYQVTQKIWKNVMGSNPSYFKGNQQPVENVNWIECKNFCDKLGLRLPTEAEWEYACRSGTNSEYYWGNSMNDGYAWYSNNSGGKTHDIGQKLPNAFGLYDMTGNTWEWCANWYTENYSVSTSNSPQSSDLHRVCRGGGWFYDARYCRSTYRNSYSPKHREDILGFRPCVTWVI